MKNQVFGKVLHGKLKFDSEVNYSIFLERMEGKSFCLEEISSKRTTSQNNFYWAYLALVSNETGHTSKELHEYFKRVFLKPTLLSVMGKEIKIPSSTVNLSKSEFAEYIDRIGAETNVPVPNPEEWK